MVVYVVKGCVDSNRESLKAKTTHTWDHKKVEAEKKIFDLGLVKEFNEETDILAESSGENKTLKAENDKLKQNAIAATEAIAKLEGMLKESVGLKQNAKPEGFDEYFEVSNG